MSVSKSENTALIDVLECIVGADGMLVGEAISERYHADWSGDAPCTPGIVLRPRTTIQVSRILKTCNEYAQPIVVQGGLTGLSGGATPKPGEISLSLERMTDIEELDAQSMTMTVGAGVLLETIQAAAREAGFTFPLDLGARGSCTIGGNIATNAGGTQVIRYGMARSLVLGMEVVLPDGAIISTMNKLIKNNAGYDLKHLFIGSEGTLGVITQLVLKLSPAAPNRATALVATSEFSDIAALLQRCNTQLSGAVSSFEVMWANFIDKVITDQFDGKHPFEERHQYYALIETEGVDQSEDAERLQAVLVDAMESGHVADALIAQSEKEANAFWEIRHGNAELHQTMSPLANFDIGVPVSEMESFVANIETALRDKFGAIEIAVFGHLGDGNLHVKASSGREEDVNAIYQTVYRIVGEHHGSVTAEHGVGTLKRPYLEYSRTPEEIALMRLLKKSMDPNGVLNAGRVI